MNDHMGLNHKKKVELLRLIAERNSVSSETIEQLLQNHQNFREIWEDYADCQAMLQRFRLMLPRHVNRIDEYELLARDIESEITQLVQKHNETDSNA